MLIMWLSQISTQSSHGGDACVQEDMRVRVCVCVCVCVCVTTHMSLQTMMMAITMMASSANTATMDPPTIGPVFVEGDTTTVVGGATVMMEDVADMVEDAEIAVEDVCVHVCSEHVCT